MSQFAAYDDASIYAIGDSPDDAIAKARVDTMAPEAQFKTARVNGIFCFEADAELIAEYPELKDAKFISISIEDNGLVSTYVEPVRTRA